MLRVKDYRKQAGLTQVELAAQIGVRPDTLSKVENGRLPLSERLELRIAHVLNLSDEDRNRMLGLPGLSTEPRPRLRLVQPQRS